MNQEIVKQKPFYNCEDIMQIMECSRAKAYEYIRIIKSFSDRGQTAGRVMVADFNKWAYEVGENQKEEVRGRNESFVRVMPFRKRFH